MGQKRLKYSTLIHTLKSDRTYIILVSVSHWMYYLCRPCLNKKQQCLTRDIELIITYSDLDTFGSDSMFVKNICTWGKSIAVIFYRISKTQFVSFFVYRRQSRDRFRIYIFIDNNVGLFNLMKVTSYSNTIDKVHSMLTTDYSCSNGWRLTLTEIGL